MTNDQTTHNQKAANNTKKTPSQCLRCLNGEPVTLLIIFFCIFVFHSIFIRVTCTDLLYFLSFTNS